MEKRIKRQIIGKPHRFFAVPPLGFEESLVQELLQIGIVAENGPEIVGDGKVEFRGKITEAWKAVACSRIANRILVEIDSFKAENFTALEKSIAKIPWELYLSPCDCQIHVTCKHSRLYHSDAIAERIRKTLDKIIRISKDVVQHLYVNFLDDRCTLWLDLAGEELYKRGQERFVNDAPLKETIAAAMIFEASKIAGAFEFPKAAVAPVAMVDPMAGSGTFSLEASYINTGKIPGLCRDFTLKHQPAFKEAHWRYMVHQESEKIKAQPFFSSILTSDLSERAVEIINHNFNAKDVAMVKDFFCYTAQEIATICKDSTPLLLLNPPYGKRLDFDAPKLYTEIGKKIQELSQGLKSLNKDLVVSILAPKDNPLANYNCTANLLRECPDLSPKNNNKAKLIKTSHGGFSLNVFTAKI